MHYKNGREAKNGDKVVLIGSYGPPVAGILYDATPGNDTCNGRIAITSPSDPCPNLQEVLHVEDVKALAFDAKSCGGATSKKHGDTDAPKDYTDDVVIGNG